MKTLSQRVDEGGTFASVFVYLPLIALGCVIEYGYKNMKTKIKSVIGFALLAMIAVCSAQASVLPDAEQLVGDVVNSPWGASVGYGRATTGNNSLVYAIITDQLVTNIDGSGFSSGPIIGYEELWSGSAKQVDSLSGGWQFSWSGTPLSSIGKTFLTNVVTTVMAYQLVATPRDSDASIGAITGMAVTVDPYPKGLWGLHLRALGGYETRAGQGEFDGRYLFAGAALSLNF